jgi:hypothetical protein
MAVANKSATGRDVVCRRMPGIATDSWNEWQIDVIEVVRQEFSSIFHNVHRDDFDWDAWRPLFDDGHDPEDAVNEALSQFERKRERKVGSKALKPSAYKPVSAMQIEVD